MAFSLSPLYSPIVWLEHLLPRGYRPLKCHFHNIHIKPMFLLILIQNELFERTAEYLFDPQDQRWRISWPIWNKQILTARAADRAYTTQILTLLRQQGYARMSDAVAALGAPSTNSMAIRALGPHPSGLFAEFIQRASEEIQREQPPSPARLVHAADMLGPAGSGEALQAQILSFLLYHGPQRWTPRYHFHPAACGQGCGCCRSHNPDDVGSGCDPCADGWALTGVSKDVCVATQTYGRRHQNAVGMHCLCGECRSGWLDNGWVCPALLWLQ